MKGIFQFMKQILSKMFSFFFKKKNPPTGYYSRSSYTTHTGTYVVPVGVKFIKG